MSNIIETAPKASNKGLAVHFGIVSWQGHASVAGHDDPRTSQTFTLPGDAPLHVEGSWTMWGVEDQDEGDDSLHAVYYPHAHEPLGDQVAYVAAWLHENTLDHNRTLDYAVVTTRSDFSVVLGVVTVDGRDMVRGYVSAG